MKTDLFPVATAEFSKFAGILSAALSEHHLSGFEIDQLEFHHLHLLCVGLHRTIQLKPDILECEVKWALESITKNKASGGDGIPVELFKILKDDAVKYCSQYVTKFGKLSSGHRTGKGQFSFQSQRKAMPKNVQITAQLHSPYTLTK